LSGFPGQNSGSGHGARLRGFAPLGRSLHRVCPRWRPGSRLVRRSFGWCGLGGLPAGRGHDLDHTPTFGAFEDSPKGLLAPDLQPGPARGAGNGKQRLVHRFDGREERKLPSMPDRRPSAIVRRGGGNVIR
jgi:hypothetical protein